MSLQQAHLRLLSFLVACFLCIAFCVLSQGCASSEPARQSAAPDDMDTNSKRSPASYFIDRFQVPKDLPEHSTKNSNLPFFFKKCNIAGEDWAGHQNYQCDVGF